MKLEKLQRTHPDFDPECITTHRDLVAGGVQFARNVARYLPKHDMEPQAVYKRRCDQSFFLGYVAPICHFFASHLFSCPLTFKVDGETAPDDEFWSGLKENVDGFGTDLDAFLRHAFLDAIAHRRAYWRLDFPSPEREPEEGDTVREWENQGLGNVRLCRIPTHEVRNWKCDEYGELEWVLQYTREESLGDIDDEDVTVTETWTQFYDDGRVRRWQTKHGKRDVLSKTADVPEAPAPYIPPSFRALPVVSVCMSPELWLVNHLAPGQLEHFRKSNALSWSIDRTCYAMPWFNLRDRRKPPTMGAGYYGMLSLDETVSWPTPPATPYQVIGDYNSALKDELHRVSHQMAMGVDNNAAAVGRSADSKHADNSATEIVLAAFGKILREPVEKTWNLIERVRGGSRKWSVGGMDDYRLPDVAGVTTNALAVDTLKIPSVTFRREMLKRVAMANLPQLDQVTKDAITSEIDQHTNPEDVLPPPDGFDDRGVPIPGHPASGIPHPMMQPKPGIGPGQSSANRPRPGLPPAK